MIRIPIAIVTCLAAATAAGDLADDVRCREIAFSRSAEHRDLQAFRSFVDADARFVSNSVLRGVDDIAEAWSVFFADDGPTIKWRPEFVEVLENGKLALSRGPYRVISKNADGSVIQTWGTFNSVWRLHDDGAWRVVFDAGNPAANEPVDETKRKLDEDDDC